MNHEHTQITSNDRAEEDAQGYIVVAPRDPRNGLPTLESLLLERLRQGGPVFPTGPLGGPLLRG